MKTTFNEFTVSTTYTGSKPAPWNAHNYHHNRVTVYDIETRKRTAFDFWCNDYTPELETEYDALNAFLMFVTDALSGAETFADFCRGLGYAEDSRTAEKTWRACKRALVKIRRVTGYSDSELCALCDELAEKYA